MPNRIRLRRSKGWRMPPNAVKVDRSTRWGNPFRLDAPHPQTGAAIDRAAAVSLYREWLLARPEILSAARAALAGKDLACWCALDVPCHADVLLELVNRRT